MPANAHICMQGSPEFKSLKSSNMDYREHFNLVIQRRLLRLLRPPPPPRPLAPGTPQINSWTDLCFLRESLAPPCNDPERVYTTFAAVNDASESDHLFFGHAPFKISDLSFAQITDSFAGTCAG
ncbi:hypothetical protein N0V85_003507 [Neurospora sp. IMI 360204]|nr:hypothetical protein N0V85_003507 [Neurospora sp. IMI 360204]